MTEKIRLQKFLAQCGVASRRKAEQLILEGKITVDGVVTKEMGISIIPAKNRITCLGKVVTHKEQLTYYLLNKPKGYVTTLADPQKRPVVTTLIKEQNLRLFPVGRLDIDTEGALILTNDGELAQKIQHPSHETNKTYELLVKYRPTDNKLLLLQKGILLEGKMTSPAQVTILTENSQSCRIKIIIHEGRKRQVKKMFAFIGHPVLELKRTAYGKLTLDRLPTGSYRKLNSSDLKKIFL